MSPGKALRTEEEMLKSNRTLKSLVIAAGIGALFAIAPAKAEDASATAAYKDIQATLGSVPDMFKTLLNVQGHMTTVAVVNALGSEEARL